MKDPEHTVRLRESDLAELRRLVLKCGYRFKAKRLLLRLGLPRDELKAAEDAGQIAALPWSEHAELSTDLESLNRGAKKRLFLGRRGGNYLPYHRDEQQRLAGDGLLPAVFPDGRGNGGVGCVCWYCGSTNRGELIYEHMRPRSGRGSDDASNIVRACTACNARKGPRDVEEFRRLLERRREESYVLFFGEMDPVFIHEGGIIPERIRRALVERSQQRMLPIQAEDPVDVFKNNASDGILDSGK